MSNNTLARSADALNTASKLLEQLQQYLTGSACNSFENEAIGQLLLVTSHIIESVGLLGEELSMMQTTIRTAGAALTGELIAPPHQCPECGLPLGSNASNGTSSGCQTCTVMVDVHRRMQGNKCPDCGCLIGTNTENCRKCLNEQFLQRADRDG